MTHRDEPISEYPPENIDSHFLSYMMEEKLTSLDTVFLVSTMTDQHLVAILALMGVLAIAYLGLRMKRFRNKIPFHITRVAIAFFLLYLISKLLRRFIEIHHITFITPKEISFLYLLAVVALSIKESFVFADQFRKYLVNTGRNTTSAQFITKAIKIVSVISILLVFGEHFGLSFAGLLTFGGIGGIAIGLAGKDILSNLFSGVMLYFDRPFNIGDWIRSPDRQIEGTVVEIGWRITKIMTFQNRPLYVPNYLFSSISVENPGRMLNWRINFSIGILADDSSKIKPIISQIKDMLEKNEGIDQKQPLVVSFNQIGASSLNILVYCFTKTTVWKEWLQVQEDVYLSIIDIVQKNGSQISDADSHSGSGNQNLRIQLKTIT